ncbi:2804_t:CDS:10 [Ambispora leptoticha]|uniref:2804_t:CDS:1 n=1 Tax=Ambispora leptoticha TaxID=144679 RepID=A0A9N9BD77_9GLOM|nr:2804_t:CDS:10 [Ambispora leptoticha]
MPASKSPEFEPHKSDQTLLQRDLSQKQANISSKREEANSVLTSRGNSKTMFGSSDSYRGSTKQELIDEDSLKEMGYENDIKIEPQGLLNTKDTWNVTLLVILYLLQGVPVGLAFGSIPFLLKSKVSYSELGIFSLATYPYSLKLLWSPIVDATFSKKIGRRKSWIIPIQLLMGTVFFWLGNNIDDMLMSENPNVYIITLIFFLLIFFSATQDIAVDGWALTLLSKNNLSYASTAQTIGLNTGYFLSFTVFLAFNSAEFSNKYFRDVPSEYGILSMRTYLNFWSFMYFAITAYLIFGKSEENVQSREDEMDIKTTYQTIWNICKMPHMRKFILVLLLSKIGFIANEAVTALKLLEKGFSKEDLALSVMVDFPFQIIFGYYAAKWSSGPEPLKPWLYAFYGRLLFAVVGMLAVIAFPVDGVSTSYFALIITTTVLSSFTGTVQFVSISAFFTTIADPVIGGTYMTLLATFSNFGGTWPRFFVLEAVDKFTDATCSVKNSLGEVVDCASEHGKNICTELNGQCNIHQDGYYVVSVATVTLGTILLFTFIRPQIKVLQQLSPLKWSLKNVGGRSD